jgi:hypothetical protein
MPHSEVTKIELKDNKIYLTVKVDGFDVDESVEISGHATQANGPNGAIATFYHLQNPPLPLSSDGSFEVTVIADPPSAGFVVGDVITVVGRAAKIWSTVLDGTDEAVWKARPESSSNP